MSDLISRESVIETLKQTGIITDNDLGHLVVEEIERIPIAYDVNKVVEKLEIISNNIAGVVENEYTYYVIQKAIEIVKGGGVDE